MFRRVLNTHAVHPLYYCFTGEVNLHVYFLVVADLQEEAERIQEGGDPDIMQQAEEDVHHRMRLKIRQLPTASYTATVSHRYPSSTSAHASTAGLVY